MLFIHYKPRIATLSFRTLQILPTTQSIHTQPLATASL